MIFDIQYVKLGFWYNSIVILFYNAFQNLWSFNNMLSVYSNYDREQHVSM